MSLKKAHKIYLFPCQVFATNKSHMQNSLENRNTLLTLAVGMKSVQRMWFVRHLVDKGRNHETAHKWYAEL